MEEEVYVKLARVLDTLPNGFPLTESGVEIKLLKKIFSPDQADLFCDMRLSFETAEQVAAENRAPPGGSGGQVEGHGQAGQLFAIDFEGTWVFKMIPWVFGIYEFQNERLDKEFVELNEEFGAVYGKQFFSKTPQLMQVLPIEKEIAVHQEALPYERVSTLIEQNQSFWVNDCICKKEQGLLGHPCDRPMQVCLAIAPVPGVFDKMPSGKGADQGGGLCPVEQNGRAGTGAPYGQSAGRELSISATAAAVAAGYWGPSINWASRPPR